LRVTGSHQCPGDDGAWRVVAAHRVDGDADQSYQVSGVRVSCQH
jgi:hypothetical protein